jgi:hypothetical protein
MLQVTIRAMRPPERIALLVGGVGLLLLLVAPSPPEKIAGTVLAVLAIAYSLIPKRLMVAFGAVPRSIPVRLSWAHQRLPAVELTPSGGPSPDLRLSVRNNGKVAKFSANGRILDLRHSPNDYRRGTYRLGWLGRDSHEEVIAQGEVGTLVIGAFDTGDPYSKLQDRMCEVTLQEFVPRAGLRRWDSARWIMHPSEAVPEFDIEVSIHSDKASRPLAKRYTVRPQNWLGPLEMVLIPGAMQAKP